MGLAVHWNWLRIKGRSSDVAFPICKPGEPLVRRRYKEHELLANRGRHRHARGGDLTSFAGMLGDSVALLIDWLAQLVRDAHDQSLGVYKERLLGSVIRDFLPKRYEVGTGFVLFPRTTLAEVGEEDADRERPPHEISRQLDLIVFDAATYPVIFRDE